MNGEGADVRTGPILLNISYSVDRTKRNTCVDRFHHQTKDESQSTHKVLECG